MKISKELLHRVLKENRFDDLDIMFMVGDIFDDDKEEEVEIESVIENITSHLSGRLTKEYHINGSGDIVYIIDYLNKYLSLVQDLEHIQENPVELDIV